MTVYSHSRLSSFEQCPYKFKLKYIDKVETKLEESVEAFLGSQVHDALEKLYRDLQYQKLNALDELLVYLNDKWQKNWNESIVIVKDYTPENYRLMAEKFITDYYHRYHPFDQQRTIALEDRILINLDRSGDYKLQGYIDRLAESEDCRYEIHDYKTNSQLPLPEYIQNDRQLALYMIGVKDRYPDAEDIKLIWHFLAFNKEIDSTRTDDELEQLVSCVGHGHEETEDHGNQEVDVECVEPVVGYQVDPLGQVGLLYHLHNRRQEGAISGEIEPKYAPHVAGKKGKDKGCDEGDEDDPAETLGEFF